MSQPAHITSLGTHIKVSNIATSREFYESLGFTPVFAYGDDEFRATLPDGLASAPEKYCGVIYQIGDGPKLEIADGHIAVSDKSVFVDMITSPKITAMIGVESLVPIITNPLVEIKVPVRRYYWNTIEAVTRDPDGFVLVFIVPFSESELAAIEAIRPVEVVNPGQVL
jgi:catechol 2,3-dioxygenase-like lactoylglutathione lyase family enzyme